MENLSTIIGVIGAVFGIVGTVGAIYFAHQNRLLSQQTTMPTMELKMNNPPPYKADTDFSEVIVKNVGQRTSGRVKVSATCSWAKEIEYCLRFPSPGWVLQPGEEYRWKVRFNHTGDTKGENITLKAQDGSITWEITEKLV